LTEEVALPSTLEIAGIADKDMKVKIIDKATGETKDINVFKGEKCPTVNLPEGNYKAQYNGMEREFTLLPGENYVLDTNNPFVFSVSKESVAPGKVRVSITAQGKGKVQFDMRGWNIQLGKKIQNSIELSDKPVKLVWEATVTDAKKPWVAVVIPDGKVFEGKEIHDIKM
jgi:hypothetical protein